MCLRASFRLQAPNIFLSCCLGCCVALCCTRGALTTRCCVWDDCLPWCLTCTASLIHKAAAVIVPIMPIRLSKQECARAVWLPTTSPSAPPFILGWQIQLCFRCGRARHTAASHVPQHGVNRLSSNAVSTAAPWLPWPCPFPATRAAQPVPRLQQLLDIRADKVKIRR